MYERVFPAQAALGLDLASIPRPSPLPRHRPLDIPAPFRAIVAIATLGASEETHAPYARPKLP